MMHTKQTKQKVQTMQRLQTMQTIRDDQTITDNAESTENVDDGQFRNSCNVLGGNVVTIVTLGMGSN